MKTVNSVSKQPCTHITRFVKKSFTFTNKSSISHHRHFFHIIPFSHIHTHTHTQTKIHELCNEFGTVWLHQNVTHWTAFSLDFPVAQ